MKKLPIKQGSISFNPAARIKFILVAFVFSFFHAIGQTVVSGKILSENLEPVPFANILIFNNSDSSLVSGTISDEKGEFSATLPSTENQHIVIRMVGFQQSIPKIDFKNAPIELGTIRLKEDVTRLNEVVVSGQKLLYEMKHDKLVVNVDGNINASGKAVSGILMQTPGVMIDQKISINGKSGAGIMINGRIIKIPPGMEVSYLEGLSLANVEKIEIISTPGANSDAEGAGGLINVIMKKNESEGVSGNISTTFGYNWKPKYGWGGSLNVSKKKFLLSIQYSDNKNHTISYWENDFRYTLNNNQYHTNSMLIRNDNLRDASSTLQMEYDLGKGNTFGANAFWLIRKHHYTHNIMDFQFLNEALQEQIQTQTLELNFWKRRGANLNYIHTFKNQSTLNLDVDRLFFHHKMPSDYLFTHYVPTGLGAEKLKTTKVSSPFIIDAFKLDYNIKFSLRWQFSTGVKYTKSDFDNNFELLK